MCLFIFEVRSVYSKENYYFNTFCGGMHGYECVYKRIRFDHA